MGDIKYVGQLYGGTQTPPTRIFEATAAIEVGDLVVGAAALDTVTKVLDNSAAVAGLAVSAAAAAGDNVEVILLGPGIVLRGAFTTAEEPELLDRACTITVATNVISIGKTGNAVFTCVGKPNSTEVDVIKTDSVAYTL